MRRRVYWPDNLNRKWEKGMSKQCLPRKCFQIAQTPFLLVFLTGIAPNRAVLLP